MQPLDLEPQLPDLSLTFVTLAPLADITAKPLDLDQDVFVATAALRGRRRIVAGVVVAVAVTTALADLVLEICDLPAQRLDRLQ